MKHYLKLILGGLFIMGVYFYLLLFSDLIADKFSLQIIGLFVIPLSLSLIVIGFIERYYKHKGE